MAKRSAARFLAETLDAHGVDLIYSVPGESYLAVTDALIDFPRIRLIVCRHEGGAGFMALADAKLTHRPATCFVSRGPGATNVSIAIHTARQDAAPMVFFIGQIERKDFGRGALQEVDYAKTFSDMAKLVIDVRDGALLSDAAARAYHVARAGTPGPVVVVLPEDMLTDETEGLPVCGPRALAQAAPRTADIERAAEMLGRAERPLLVLGGAIDHAAGAAAALRLADAWGLPACTVFQRPHQFQNAHANYAGNLGVYAPGEQMKTLREADLVLCLGARMTDLSSNGYSFPRAPVPDQPVIHVYPDPEAIGRVFQATLGIACDPMTFAEALLALPPKGAAARRGWIERLHGIDQRIREYKPRQANDGVAFGAVVNELRRQLRPDAIISSDAGNFSGWVARYMSFGPEGAHVGALSGAMGGGVPGAVAAGLRHPGRQVIGVAGDGGFLMTGNELATAMLYDVPVKLFVSNNASYGTIRLHQELLHPGRVTSTELRNPNFAAWGEAFGAKGLRITRDADVVPAVTAALAHDGPVVVEVATSLYHLTPAATLDDLAQIAAKRAARAK
jgi:acetolactate synthase-1/2/3 large subunit